MEKILITFLVISMSFLLLIISSLQYQITKINFTINKIANEIGVTTPPIDFDKVDFEVMELIKEGNKIKAIKKYRELTGIGLKEAKEYIDKLAKIRSTYNYSFNRTQQISDGFYYL